MLTNSTFGFLTVRVEELNRILKFGSKDLFEDDAEEGRITYDDDAITALLDRYVLVVATSFRAPIDTEICNTDYIYIYPCC